ncbi:MAG: DUF1295 domain-containing protein [Saprospiraceae bacterium]
MKSAKALRIIFFLSIILLPIFLLNNPLTPFFQKGILMILGIMTLLWLFSLAIKDSSIVDIFWGIGFVITAWFYAYIIGFEKLNAWQYIFLGMVSIWGSRLAIYLGMRNIGKGEDFRYAQWRKESGKNWWWISFLRVFVLQGIILWIVSSIFVPALLATKNLPILIYAGITLWAIGLYFEAIGDYQLMQFKNNPNNKGKVLNTGVWKYTRHPNYFGDALLWWGFFCFAFAHSSGWTFIFSPLLMTFLLLKISGVAMLEKTLKNTKPEYEEYIKKTSAFIPWPPK